MPPLSDLPCPPSLTLPPAQVYFFYLGRVLQGVGVGDSTATPLAATITWILKDGAGMIGRILFAGWSGSSLDYDCKER